MDTHAWVVIVEGLYANTLLLTAMSSLWVFEWLLNLGDKSVPPHWAIVPFSDVTQIEYGWGGRKSLTFWLFIANRYTPAGHIIWLNIVQFAEIEDWPVSCHITGWFAPLEANVVTIVPQLAIAMRVYAVTGKNKLLCSPLAFLITAQIVSAIVATIFILRRPDQILPEEILRLFRLCAHERWKPGALSFVSIALAFDITAFSIIVYRVRRELPDKSLGITTLWSVILRDATLYFVVIVFLQFVALLFLFATPQAIQLAPGLVNAIVVPIMAARLMLSLKSAAANPTEPWSLKTMSRRVPTDVLPGGGSLHFASHRLGTSYEPSGVPTRLDEDGFELSSVP